MAVDFGYPAYAGLALLLPAQAPRPWRWSARRRVMVRVAGGSFNMGRHISRYSHCCGARNPVHWVRLRGFEIRKLEVTHELWEVEKGNRPSRFAGCARCPVDGVSRGDLW